MGTISITTMEATRICGRCGATVPSFAPDQLCPRCLFDTACDSHGDPSPDPAAAGSVTRAGNPVEPPKTFGDYDLLAELGRGGQGVVYRARHRAMGRIVALKTIPPSGLTGARARERFRLEATMASRLDHPNIVPVYEAGERDGFCYYSMKLMEGGTIDQATKSLPPETDASSHIAGLTVRVARAVHHAHQRGVLHRDLKPSNILLDSEQEPQVSDFGLARELGADSSLTWSHGVMGTPAYLAPEIAAAGVRQATIVSDVYGLGSVLYHLLTGRPPFLGDTLAGILRAVQEDEPVRVSELNPAVPRDLETICLKCLDKEPSKRYDTAQELADDLERFLNDEPIVARPVGSTERLWRWCRRKPALAGLSAGLVLALAAGFAGTLWQLNEAQRNAAENRRQIARLNVLNGINLMQDGDHFRSLLWFADALALNADPPAQAAVNRLRIASIIAQGPRLITVITHDGQPVGDAAFDPVQDQLATVGRDRRLRVWDIPTGEMLFMTEPFDKLPSDVQFAPDGERILLTSSEFNHTRLFSATDGEPLAGPILHFAGGANNLPLPPRFDKGGKLLLTQSAPKTVRVWSSFDASPQGPAITLDAPIAWMNFSEDGRTVVSITQDGRTRAWDWKTGNEVVLPVPKPGAPTALSSRTGHQPLADMAVRAPESSRTADDWAASAPRPALETRTLSPDGTRFASIAADHRARVWSADTGEPLTPPLDHKLATGPVEFSASGRYFFTMHPAHAVFVWDLSQTREPPVLLRPSPPHTLAESGQDGSVFVTRDPNSPIRVRALSGPTEVSLHPSSLKEIPVQAWFDATGQFIVLEGEKMRAQIWDAATGLPVTPKFPSRPATNETDYRTVKLPLPPTFDFRLQTSDIRPLAELLAGSRLDGTGGWKPLELGEVVARWNEVNGKPLVPTGGKGKAL